MAKKSIMIGSIPAKSISAELQEPQPCTFPNDIVNKSDEDIIVLFYISEPSKTVKKTSFSHLSLAPKAI
jgi:hypothetical protein